MPDSTNPYQPPELAAAQKSIQRRSSADWPGLLAWPVVFAVNLVIPVLFGWSLTLDSGRGGVCAAVMLFLVGGWALCLYRPPWARRLILGAGCVALTQLVPLLQMIAGIVALEIASHLGLAAFGEPDYQPDRILNEAGGFLVTVVVGTILLAAAAVIGLAIGLLVPARWLSRSAG